MHKEVSLRGAPSTVWLRLMCLAILGLALAERLHLSRGTGQGWSYYWTGPERKFA